MPRKSPADIGRTESRPTWAALGFDTSLSAIAGAGVMYDGVLDKYKGPALHSVRWNHGEQWYDRLVTAARAEKFVHSLMSELGFVNSISDIYIAVEDAWPAGLVKRAQSSWLSQQAEITGAFVGGLLRYGYAVYRVNAQTWKGVVARELGMKLNREFDKWTVKQWALGAYNNVPDLPDLIQREGGKIPRPENSTAKAVQPDDIYDALGIMSWMESLVETQLGGG